MERPLKEVKKFQFITLANFSTEKYLIQVLAEESHFNLNLELGKSSPAGIKESLNFS